MARTSDQSNPLREGLRTRRAPDPCVVVIFGASGDLTERKLVPALYYLARQRHLPASFAVVGAARTKLSEEEFRGKMREAVRRHLKVGDDEDEALQGFLEGFFYDTDQFTEVEAYERLRGVIEKLDAERGTAGNRLFYLATPPSSFPGIVKNLGKAGLAKPQDPSKNWTRVVIEKPFGRDLESARELNRVVTGVFDEDQVYRIDHYLGKETVQNLVVLRFANGIFEPVWNRRYIDHVEITVAEDLGVEGRGAYYEEAGALRDMIQNHVLQLLCLVAMEPPAAFRSWAVHDEKAKVLRAVRPIPLDRLEEFAVRAQYAEGFVRGEKVPAYRKEPKVKADSTTETYAAVKLLIDNWRWADVPFYLRSGKRLSKRVSEISVVFKSVPHLLFREAACDRIEPNLLAVHLQPNEGISLKFSAKLPGTTLEIRPVVMDFRYGESFGATPPTAYETLLLDSMLGDSTLFTRRDEVELSWELFTPLLEAWQERGADGLAFYESGSWGPREADEFIRRDGRSWQRL
jgi:glucose-6-phosphate 1-dehydrogenase